MLVRRGASRARAAQPARPVSNRVSRRRPPPLPRIPPLRRRLGSSRRTRLVHADVSRTEVVAETVMALILGLLRRTHLLSRHALSAAGWLGSVQPLCRGMRRCRRLVLGIGGRSASAAELASRSLAFKMSVLYFDDQKGKW